MPDILEFLPATEPDHLNRLLFAFLDIWNHPSNLPYLSLSLRPFEEATVREWFAHHTEAGVRYFGVPDSAGSISAISVIRVDPIATFELVGLGVREDQQGRGLGCALVRHALELGASLSFRSAEASVFADNARMLRLLLALGFLPVRMEYHRRGDGADIVVLRKELRLPDQSATAETELTGGRRSNQ